MGAVFEIEWIEGLFEYTLFVRSSRFERGSGGVELIISSILAASS